MHSVHMKGLRPQRVSKQFPLRNSKGRWLRIAQKGTREAGFAKRIVGCKECIKFCSSLFPRSERADSHRASRFTLFSAAVEADAYVYRAVHFKLTKYKLVFI